MANALFDKARQRFLEGQFNWNTDTIKAVLVDTGTYTVHIEVKDGAARFVDSPCPDHICEGYGWLSAEDQSATCLPARAVPAGVSSAPLVGAA